MHEIRWDNVTREHLKEIEEVFVRLRKLIESNPYGLGLPSPTCDNVLTLVNNDEFWDRIDAAKVVIVKRVKYRAADVRLQLEGIIVGCTSCEIPGITKRWSKKMPLHLKKRKRRHYGKGNE